MDNLFAQFTPLPWWAPASFVIWVAYLAYFVAFLVHWRTVSGSRPAYVASTIMRTLCIPLFAAYIFSVPMDAIAGDGLGVFFDFWIASIMYRDWQRLKDSDDWWKGKGTKLKKKLRSMLTSPSPAAGVAGAGA